MAHEIELPIDQVFSIEGTEWHGNAEHVKSITAEFLKERNQLQSLLEKARKAYYLSQAKNNPAKMQVEANDAQRNHASHSKRHRLE